MSAHRHCLRVYYEDTDAGGVVYHATYVCFFERARTEWLRAHGFTHEQAAQQHGVVFAVKSLNVRYQKPARLDDWLTVETRAAVAGRSRVRFEQQLLCEEVLLATATVEVVCVSGTPFRAVAIPPALQALIAP